jgi:hypothetical protein
MNWKDISWGQYILVSLGSFGLLDFTVQMITGGEVKLIHIVVGALLK